MKRAKWILLGMALGIILVFTFLVSLIAFHAH